MVNETLTIVLVVFLVVDRVIFLRRFCMSTYILYVGIRERGIGLLYAGIILY